MFKSNGNTFNMSDNKGMMDGLLSGEDLNLIIKWKILLILSIQSITSSILAYLCFEFESFANFFTTNFWLIYLSFGLYIAVIILGLAISFFKKPLISAVFILIIALSTNLLDSCATALNPKSIFPVFVNLFAGAFGSLLYLLIGYKFYRNKWSFFCAIITNIWVFVGFALI